MPYVRFVPGTGRAVKSPTMTDAGAAAGSVRCTVTSYGAQPVSASVIAAFGIKATGPSSGFGSLSRSTMSMSLSRIVTPDGPEMRMLMFSSASSSVSPSKRHRERRDLLARAPSTAGTG